MVAQALAMALDPVRMAEGAGIVPDPWQADMLRSVDRQAILLCSRQSGKSTVSACLAAHQAVYIPGSLVLLLSPSQRQSGELYRKVRDVLAALDEAPPPSEESALRLALPNGSRIVSLPGKESTIRGYSGVDLLIVDEASRVPDALYQAVRPMLAVSGGRVVLLSTPFGRRGFFYQEWEHGGPDWRRFKIPAWQCPRIPAAWLAAERKRIPGFVFDQEYGVQFLDSENQFIASVAIDAATDPRIRPLYISGAIGVESHENDEHDPWGADGAAEADAADDGLDARIGPWAE